MDAIAIPAGRAVTQRFRRFLDLAEALDCPVVVLCSGAATARDVAALAGAGVDLFAVDVPADAREALPPLETLAVLSGTPFAHGTDIALKRNLALLLAQLAGWERMVFFDDDVSNMDPEDVRHASALLDTYDAVGPAIDWFPDGSVVGHAERELGRPTERYVSCGNLAVAPIRTASFFPEIYNEDWLYLLDTSGPRTVAITGTAWQDPYDPFADPTRARCEEIGEVVVVGLYWVMANGGVATDADEPFWREYIDARLDL
ncbi:MAG TPA: hypothetical protein VFT95_00810, partial [Micromonosporaceae bacterium]|nr:hypothetical protein [Micromonosporaceae bacterium]